MKKDTYFRHLICIVAASLCLLPHTNAFCQQNTSPLCFTARNGSVEVRFDIKNVQHTIQYSTDGANWSNYSSGLNVTINANQSIYFRAATNQDYSESFGYYNIPDTIGSHFSFSSIDGGTVEGSGNIMSLYGPDCPNISLEGTFYHCCAFERLFWRCDILTTSPELPATILADDCYREMFYGCTSLIAAPVLPATSLTYGCYYGMFRECTSLTVAPDLPATTLAYYCYTEMFMDCESLITAPVLPATSLTYECYYGMFRQCSSLSSAPNLPATDLASGCYSDMFLGCHSLTTAPSLPATTMETACYRCMFMGCDSLTTAPALPATILADGCYSEMFGFCTSLTQAPTLPATSMDKCCYSFMFYGCTSLTTAPDLPATSLNWRCYSSMFEDCTSLTTAPRLLGMTMSDDCYQRMFANCTSLKIPPRLESTTLADNCYESMFEGCTSLSQLPTLPAENLKKYCYANMFKNCTSIMVNTQEPGVSWKIPFNAVESDHWADSIFVGTSGSFQGIPVIGQEYYISCDTTTNGDEVKDNRAIILAPNPVNVGETIYIKGDFTTEEMNGMTVDVIRTDGMLVSRTYINSTQIEISGIDCSGIYIIRITTSSGKSYTQKLIVE